MAWKEHLREQGHAGTTINSMLAAVRTYLQFMGWEDCCVRALRLQRRMFREPERELTRAEYLRLLSAARALDRERPDLRVKIFGSMGLSVQELARRG